MNSVEFFDLLISDGEYLLKHGTREGRTQWRINAEKLLKKHFGSHWEQLVDWKRENINWDSKHADRLQKKHMSRLIGSLKSSRATFDVI